MSANENRDRGQTGAGGSSARSLQLAVMQAPGVSIERAAQRGRGLAEATATPLRRAGISYAAWAQAAA